MRTNTNTQPDRPAGTLTHEGARVLPASAIERLRRLTMTCLLWEDGFYVDGHTSAQAIKKLVSYLVRHGRAEEVYRVAHEAKHRSQLRHVPLYLARLLAKKGAITGDQLAALINRVDDIPEFLALYRGTRAPGREPLSRQVKKGLRKAFLSFSPWQLARYRKNDAVFSLRDALLLLHVRPTPELAETFARLAAGTLAASGSWEKELSQGQNKAEVFTRLIQEKKLGALATLRNLRGMQAAGVDMSLVHDWLTRMPVERLLPFQFVKALEYAPELMEGLNTAMLRCLASSSTRLEGTTLLLIDTSGSMESTLSKNSELTRCDAAKGLAILMAEVCPMVHIFEFNHECRSVEQGDAHGLALLSQLSAPDGGTDIDRAVQTALEAHPDAGRLVILTDEQSTSDITHPDLPQRTYIVNVA
ncbi:MAG TPA: TROVE domain-containing protein, partial [Spirochaetota bacterium]|nr:TROVE domain-containing protein [Spirochaetota bacterium]